MMLRKRLLRESWDNPVRWGAGSRLRVSAAEVSVGDRLKWEQACICPRRDKTS